jgi:hypothetical protein
MFTTTDPDRIVRRVRKILERTGVLCGDGGSVSEKSSSGRI